MLASGLPSPAASPHMVQALAHLSSSGSVMLTNSITMACMAGCGGIGMMARMPHCRCLTAAAHALAHQQRLVAADAHHLNHLVSAASPAEAHCLMQEAQLTLDRRPACPPVDLDGHRLLPLLPVACQRVGKVLGAVQRRFGFASQSRHCIIKT